METRGFPFQDGLGQARELAAVFAEDLNSKGMQRLCGREIMDLGRGCFLRILERECLKKNYRLGKIYRFYPGGRTCSLCLLELPELPLPVREWERPKCGVVRDRGENAARNIRRAGASARGAGAMRPVSTGKPC
ncbi:MAG: transposase [Deltaproteobacteria bacterium]|nr:transposase [Deltaproteobacteria bacterium]